MLTCKICNSKMEKKFEAIVLKKYTVDYFLCPFCEYLQTERPFWHNEAYEQSISITDTGLVQRNLAMAAITKNIIRLFFNSRATFVDIAGGYGLFVRLMRDKGFDFLWNDIFTTNIFARGFEYINNVKQIELITAFEVFEHYVDPINEIEKILTISRNILFSTLLKPMKIPNKNWWYYGFDHGQHISFYSKKTFLYIAKKYDLIFYTNNRNIHLLLQKQVNKIILFCLFRFFTCNKFLLYNSSYAKRDNKFLISVG